MAKIVLTEIPDFKKNSKNNIINRVNSIGHITIHNNKNNTSLVLNSIQNDPSLAHFECDGILYGRSQTKKIANIKSFQDLNIKTIDGNSDYNPELKWVDSSCDGRVYIVDSKLNSKDKTQHIVKYDYPKLDPNDPQKKNPCNLDEVIIQTDNQEICHFAACESRTYNSNYGGYPILFYIINEKGEVMEFDTLDYRSKIVAKPQALKWKTTNFKKKEGFVRLTENSYYWSKKEELIYAFGLKKNNSNEFFFLELVNKNALQTDLIKNFTDEVKLDFGNHIDINLQIKPRFDSATCLDDKEFLITMIPIVNEVLDSSCRDIYWFRLKNSKDEAILFADPYRLTNIDRLDKIKNYDYPTCIRHVKDALTLDDIIYLITGQDTIQKFKMDFQP